MNKVIISTACALLASTLPSAAAGEGVKVEHLGTNNTLVRVDSDNPILLLPVQESVDDATVRVIVDGKIADTFYVRLAKSKVDYTVPFDISAYAGHNVMLNVLTSQNRSSVREAKEDVCWSALATADDFDSTNREKYRPAFHHTPLWGWMNDPNGMFYDNGVWHLYYQWNPYGSKWQNMTWGHSTSKDLVNWEHHPAAIRPQAMGSVFSGSAVTDKNNTAGFGSDAVVAMYTTADASQTQSIAHSHDGGLTYEIYPGNPVLTMETEARDPKVFFNDYTGEWNMVLAHALDHEILFFSSKDLKNWTRNSAFGKVAAQGGVWECPDLFELAMPDGSKKWVLIVNLNPGGPFGGSGVQYFTGSFDGKTFTPDRDANGDIPTKWLDYGKDNYALVSWFNAPENRRTAIGWMSNWQYAADVPTMQYRSANTLPRELSLFSDPAGLTRVASLPSPEVDGLRGRLFKKSGATGLGRKPKNFVLPQDNDGICEICLGLDAPAANVDITLSNQQGEKVVMTYNATDRTLSFDRTASGKTDFSLDFPAVTTAPTFETDGRTELRIFIDRSSIEVFCNDGRSSMTNLVFPESPYTTLGVSATDGKAKLTHLEIYTLKAN
ncbi:MAG: DUF4980 domain-containing protein [Muribaculaceae bacterium]|nr:DUF4980 domain-containing protein [Muribaculaceae bacterium]